MKKNRVKKAKVIDVTLIKYFFQLIFRNKIALAFMLLNILIIVGATIFVFAGKDNTKIVFYENNLLFILAPIIPSILFLALTSILIFSKTKLNNVDLFLYIKPYKNKYIVLNKQLSILLSSLHVLIGLIGAFIVMLSFGVSSYKAIIYFMVMILCILLSNIYWIFIMTFVAIFLNYFLGIISILFIAFASIIGMIFSVFIVNDNQNNNNFNFAENQQNIAKIYDISQNGEISEKSFVLVENPSAKNRNKIQSKKDSDINPFNFALSFAPWLMKNSSSSNLSSIDIYFASKDYSVTYQDIRDNFFIKAMNYKNPVIFSAETKTIFDYYSKISLYEDMDKQFNELPEIKKEINNKNYWKIFETELKARKVWQNSLSIEQLKIINWIIGTSSTDSLAYQVFKNNELVKNRITLIDKYFEEKYSHEFASFIKYLWEDPIVKQNLWVYKALGNTEDLEKYHPSLRIYDEFAKANFYDIEYIKNVFFNTTNLNGNFKIRILDENKVYKDITNLNTVFGQSIASKQELDNYIDLNSTVNNLSNLQERLKNSQSFNPLEISFRNNVINTGKYTTEFKFDNKSKFTWNILFTSLFIILSLIAQLAVFKKVTKGDLI